MLQNKCIRGLYGITPEHVPATILETAVAEALAGGMCVLQYRAKSLPDEAKRKQAQRIFAMCRKADVPFLVNDDLALAVEIGADGVHLGREDATLSSARRALGHNKIIGVSCYNDLSLASHAANGGADYIAFGSFFPSATKPTAVRADPSLIVQARQRFNIPIVAIGGVTLENAPQLIAAGADALAVISDLFGTNDVRARASHYQTLFDTHVR